jgi:hypothetical protein
MGAVWGDKATLYQWLSQDITGLALASQHLMLSPGVIQALELCNGIADAARNAFDVGGGCMCWECGGVTSIT